MKLTIDTDRRTLTQDESGTVTVMDLYSKSAFELISRHWVRVGWSLKYPYTFSWMGRPIIQLPEDMVRTQEVVYRLKPDVIIEAGVAHGGSLIYYASLCKVLGKGRVIGVDIEIRSHNRRAIEAHELASFITLIEGDSTSQEVVKRVKAYAGEGATALVLLDSNHSKEHVLKELEAYHELVSPGSYIVATDGLMRDLHDVPRGSADWTWNNPAAAAQEFVRSHPEFVIEQPAWPFSESELTENVTHWPAAWLRRI
ncbi:MAG: class I SAM-dependent methyltransferase [Betaproteobacteria bacterium]|nr:class I SAM-dependent methyltransferase [Betaproteobacteria bacterium]